MNRLAQASQASQPAFRIIPMRCWPDFWQLWLSRKHLARAMRFF